MTEPMNATTCKNCTHDFEGNYCNNCGQTAHTHTMDWHYVWHEVEHGVLHVDKGLLFTIKELFIRPGQTIRAFIAGKRITYFKPVAMVIFLATIYGFLYHYFDVKALAPVNSSEGKAKAMELAMQNWMTSHYTLVVLLMIPLYALSSKIAFYKAGYNYVEHLALNSFLAGMKVTFQILLFPLLYMWQKSKNIELVLTLSFVQDLVVTIYVYASFFNKFRIGTRIFRIFLSYIVLLLMSLLVGIAVGVVIALKG
jgi:hypothetical protein